MNRKRVKQSLGVVLAMTLLIGKAMTAHGAVAMPSFSLPSVVDGQTVESSSYSGKALLVTFFATWCAPCRKEIPVLKELQKKYSQEGFSIIGISVDEKGPAIVAKLVEKEQINYPVLMADTATPREFGGIFGIPTSFLVNKAGHVVKKYPGYIPRSLLEKDIKSIL